MTNTPDIHHRSGRRTGRRFVIGAAAVGIALGAAGLASAAQAVLSSDDGPTPPTVSVQAEAKLAGDASASQDDHGVDATETSVEDSTESSVTESSVDDHGDDHGDDSADDNATASSIDDHGDDSSTSTQQALLAPFVKTYTSAGGSITVSWTGTVLTLVSVDAADGSSPEIKDQQWDRVRVEFTGSVESRIEVRLNDDLGALRVRIG